MCINENYSKVWVGKRLFDALPIQNGMKKVDDLSLFIFTFVLVYDIRKVENNQVVTKLNGTHQHVVHDKQEVGLEVKAEKTEYVFMSHERNAGKNYSIKFNYFLKNRKFQIFRNDTN
jgi:hypothetical protein